MKKADLFLHTGMVLQNPKTRSKKKQKQRYAVFLLTILRKKGGTFLRVSLRRREYCLPGRTRREAPKKSEERRAESGDFQLSEDRVRKKCSTCFLIFNY